MRGLAVEGQRSGLVEFTRVVRSMEELTLLWRLDDVDCQIARWDANSSQILWEMCAAMKTRFQERSWTVMWELC